MKNIHILQTKKPSRIRIGNNGNFVFGLMQNSITSKNNSYTNQNIYITSDEEIKEGVDQWYLDKFLNKPMNSGVAQYGEKQNVIILTTDQDLIKDGVQAIDDEFLEWFVKNPSCEFVEVVKGVMKLNEDGEEYGFPDLSKYKIIIPQEKPKQEQDKNKFSEEDLREAFRQGIDNVGYCQTWGFYSKLTEQDWFEQFKKK
jgi:hypothetical protein